MDLNPWKFFFIIITNLVAILFIFLFYKHYFKKSNSIEENVVSENKNETKTEKSKNIPVCPFMAAFKKGKMIEELKKKKESNLKIASHIKQMSSDHGAVVASKVKTKKNEEIKLKPIEKNIVNTTKISSEECKVPEFNKSDPVQKSLEDEKNLENVSSENSKPKLTSSLKKVTSPEGIKSFYEHIPAHVKQLEQEKLMMTLKPEEREEEVKVRYSQLEQIYKLMGEKSELFGISSFDEIHDQMKLYVQ